MVHFLNILGFVLLFITTVTAIPNLQDVPGQQLYYLHANAYVTSLLSPSAILTNCVD